MAKAWNPKAGTVLEVILFNFQVKKMMIKVAVTNLITTVLT